MQRNIASDEGFSLGEILRLTGAFTAILSVVTGLVILFALPAGCSVIASFALVLSSIFLIIGVLTFIAGVILLKRQK